MQEASGVAITDHIRSARLYSFFDPVTDCSLASLRRSSSWSRIQSQVAASSGMSAYALRMVSLRRVSHACKPSLQWACGQVAVGSI